MSESYNRVSEDEDAPQRYASTRDWVRVAPLKVRVFSAVVLFGAMVATLQYFFN